MSIYFVDTWFFVAFFHKHDPDHDTALRLEITHILTNDRHFQQEGFAIVNQ